MKTFFKDFLKDTDLSARSPNEVTVSLSMFKVSVSPEVCKNYSEKILIETFVNVFQRLHQCSESDSVSIRVSSFPTLTSFLSKMVRSYPIEIQRAFVVFASKQSSPSKGSILLIFAFSYICNFIAKPFLEKFVNSVPIFHHFVSCGSSSSQFNSTSAISSSSDYLTNVIACLPEFENITVNAVLASFIVQYQKTHDSNLLKPIAKIVEMDPTENTITDMILKCDEMPIISFVFTTLNIDGENFDMKNIALSALKKLATATFSEIEECFQILAINSKSFKVNISIVSDDELKISMDDDFSVIKISEFQNLPYFYSLPLPNSLLFPKSNDTNSIVLVKFNTISRILKRNENNIIDVDHYVDIFEMYVLNKYSDTVSSALKSFAASLKCLVMNSTDFRLVRILKSIFNVKIRSWFHGFDILTVMEKLGNDLLEYIPLKDRISLLLKLALNKKENLSNKAVKIIAELTNGNNFTEVTSIISKDIDFFSSYSIQKHLKALSSILMKFPSNDRDHLKWIHSILLSVEMDYLSNLYTLSEILNFMRFFNNSQNRLSDIAYTILIYSIFHLKGKDFRNRVLADFTFYGEKVDKYLNTKSIDITTERPYDFIENFPLIHNAFSFFISQMIEKKPILFMIDYFFDYFPAESAEKLVKLDDKSLVEKLHKKLIIVTDSHIIGMMCKLINNDFMAIFARYYLSHSNLVKANDFYSFAVSLDAFGHKYEALIIVSLLDMNKSIVPDVIILSLQNQQFSSKYSKQLNSFSSVLCKNFSQKSNEEKLIDVRRFLNEQEDHIEKNSIVDWNNNDFIDFALNHLMGWEYFAFQAKIIRLQQKQYPQNQNQNLPPEQNNEIKNHLGKDNILLNENAIRPRAFNKYLKCVLCDDLDSKFQFYSDLDSIERVKYFLRLSIIHQQTIDINNLKLTEKIQQMSYRFYAKRGVKINCEFDINDEIRNLIALNENNENNYIMPKSRIISLCKNYKLIDKNSSDIFELLKIIIERYPSYNYITLLLMCKVIIERNTEQIPKEFISFYFQQIKNKTESFPLKIVSYSLYLLSKRTKFENEHNLVLRSLFCLCGLNSVELSVLFTTMVAIAKKENGNEKIIFGNLTEVTANLIESELPSRIIAGIQILKQVLNFSHNPIQVCEIVEPFLTQIFNRIHEFKTNHPFLYKIRHFLNAILMNQNVKLQIYILSNIFPFISEIDEFIVLVSSLISICSPKSRIYQNLIKFSDNLAANNAINVKYANIYVETLSNRLRKINDQAEREKKLMSFVMSYVQETRYYDSYFIQNIYKRWAWLIRTNFSSELSMKLLIQQFMPNSQRFFPIFVVLAEEVKISSKTEEKIVENAIANAIKLIPGDAHICALQTLISRKSFKEALDIALIEINYIDF